MKIRPKPRRYNDDELDESYFAARSNGEEKGGSWSDENQGNQNDINKRGMREFKIYDKKLETKRMNGNYHSVTPYEHRQFIPVTLFGILGEPYIIYVIFAITLRSFTIFNTGSDSTMMATLLILIFIKLFSTSQDIARKYE